MNGGKCIKALLRSSERRHDHHNQADHHPSHDLLDVLLYRKCPLEHHALVGRMSDVLLESHGYRESVDCDRCGCSWNLDVMWPEDVPRGAHYTSCPCCGILTHVHETDKLVDMDMDATTLFDPQDETQAALLGLKWVSDE